MKQPILRSLLATTALLGSAGVHAAMITQWQVKVDSIFDTTSVVWDNSNGTSGTSASSSLLKWGTPAGGTGQSSLAIGNSPATTYVNTNGPAVNNVTITHSNHPITGTTLDRVNILSTLTLTPWIPSLPGLDSVTQTFTVNFQETTNDPRPGLCADGGAYGTGLNTAGCADIFVISQDSLNFAFPYYDSVDDIIRTYYISFFEATDGLNSLSNAACTAAGAGFPCLGFETAEDAVTEAQFAALITSEPVIINVPEPGILALFGIALAGFGMVRRRKI